MNPKAKKLGQASVGALVGVSSLIASIAAPVMWVGSIKEVNAVQDNRLTTIENSLENIGNKLDGLVTKEDLNRIYNQQDAILKSLRSNPNY